MLRILYKVIYFLSFSECTHPIISRVEKPVEKSEDAPVILDSLQLLVDAYEISDASIQQCLEIIFANLSFTFGSHPALISHGILDKLKDQYHLAASAENVRLPVALALINIGLNPENLNLLEEDFLHCVVLAKEVKGVSDAIKLKLLKAFGDYLNFVKNNMSHLNTTLFPLLEEYIMHVLMLENRGDELPNAVISILLNIVSEIHHVFFRVCNLVYRDFCFCSCR